MPKKKKRKLSAYQLHMSRELKKGKTFKQAVASWKGGKRTKSTKKTTKRKTRRKSMARKKKRKGPNAITKMLMRFRGWFKQGLRAGSLVLPMATSVATQGFNPAGIGDGLQKYTGVNPATGEMNPARLVEGWAPVILVSLILKVARGFGV